jgi:predicted transcriptional regulator
MVNTMKRLPEAEFEVMKSIWETDPPVTTSMLMERLGNHKNWQRQTLIALLLRLMDRGFLRSEKNSKERTYYPLVDREEYLRFETGQFVERYHDRSILSLINALYDGRDMESADLNELSQWLKNRGGK